ncbi:MAG: hypothetical protein V4666_08265 [Bacteroidota bacterium]
MKVVNKNTFYDLPSGTVYSMYEPMNIFGLKIKGNTLRHGHNNLPYDYTYVDLVGNVLHDSSEEYFDLMNNLVIGETSFHLDFECHERDGMFEPKEMFCIYERADLIGLINKLTKSLNLIK